MSSELFPLDALAAKVVAREVFDSAQVDEAASGKEARSSWWNAPRYRYKLASEVVRSDIRYDFQRFLGLFRRHAGRLDSYLLRDAEDYTVTDHGFGVGDNATTTFQLQRTLLGTKAERGTGGPYATSSKPRTNICLQSQTFDNATWTKTDASISANAAIAPDGTATADKLVEAATVAAHMIAQPGALVAGTAYTFSVWVKSATRSQVMLAVEGESTAGIFDLSALTTSTAAGSPTLTITECSGGWYRCACTWTALATGSADQEILLAVGGVTGYSGNGTSGLYIWGAQLEAASASTKYIPTVASTVTVTPSYWPGYADGFEPVDEPDLSTVLIYVDGVLKTLTTHYSISATGLVTFVSAPASNAVLSWTGEFYRRVRFEGQGMAMTKIGSHMWAIPTIDLVSCRSVT